MTRSDFYSSYRKEVKVDFLENYGLLEYWVRIRYDITQSDFRLLLKLNALGNFITADFRKRIFGWDDKKRKVLIDTGWVELYRRRDGSSKNYNVYRTTKKTRRMIDSFYKKLLKEEEISTSARSNPIYAEDACTAYKRHRPLIEEFNEEVREKNR